MAPLLCCVGGCKSTSDTHRLYNLPKIDKLRSLWLDVLVARNPNLILLSKDQLITKKVCQLHFEPNQIYSDGRRSRYAVPSLFTKEEILHKVPLRANDGNILSEHNYSKDAGEFIESDQQLTTLTSDGKISFEHSYQQNMIQVTAEQDDLLVRGAKRKPAATTSELLQITSEQDDLLVRAAKRKPAATTSELLQITSEQDDLLVRAAKRKPAATTSELCKTRGKQSGTKEFNKKLRKISIKQKNENFASRINSAKELSKTINFEQNILKLPQHAQNFLNMQLKLAGIKKKGARFTLQEKILSLALMKESPKGYRFLQKIFLLPSKRTLNRLSENVAVDTGLNEQLLSHIKTKVAHWDVTKKLCSIVFDEMAISSELNFNESKDKIYGFVDNIDRSLQYADHVLVFMLRGICSSWRQPIAYYFVENSVSQDRLSKILKDVVHEVNKTGLIPLALICDQGSTFRSTMNKLLKETKAMRMRKGEFHDGTVEIDGISLSIIFDPPHLLKSVRNNMLTKDMLFEGETASWKDIETVYSLDCQLGHTRMLPKLTESHIYENKMKKMKVKNAAQVLSARTSAVLKYTSSFQSLVGGAVVSSTMKNTGEAVEFFDSLFDSVNGSRSGACQGKMRGAIKPNSKHSNFWAESIKKLEKIKYIEKSQNTTGKPIVARPPCLNGWITTLESFQRLSKILFQKYQIKYFYGRHLNQDPLENFFGRIRSINYRHNNPSAQVFINSFKSLLISNSFGSHSEYANCEDDIGNYIVEYSKCFFEKNIEPATKTFEYSNPNLIVEEAEPTSRQVLEETVKVQTSAYTAGFISKKVLKKVKCKKCSETIISKEVGTAHKLISFREYKTLKNRNLSYPNTSFIRLYRRTTSIVHNFLNKHCFKENIAANIKNIIKNEIDLVWLGCPKHHTETKDLTINLILRIQIHNWCNQINQILRGRCQKKDVEGKALPHILAYNKNIKKVKKKGICASHSDTGVPGPSQSKKI